MLRRETGSWDRCLGRCPGAAGLPRDAGGNFSLCVPDPQTSGCVKPYHDARDLNFNAPHAAAAATADIAGGQMNGFITQAESIHTLCRNVLDPNCTGAARNDVMGYHDAREIPNYWRYASDFVLQDRMFEPNASWSLPEHLFMVSGWSALCPTPTTDARGWRMSPTRARSPSVLCTTGRVRVCRTRSLNMGSGRFRPPSFKTSRGIAATAGRFVGMVGPAEGVT